MIDFTTNDYESRCKPCDYPLIEESLEEFYNSRRIYLKSKKFSDKALALSYMSSTYFLAKGHMSMGTISSETLAFLKEHLEEGLE